MEYKMVRNVNILSGLTLIALGTIHLLHRFGVLTDALYVWPILFASGGGLFLAFYLVNHTHWWPLLSGFALLSLAIVIGSDSLLAPGGRDLSGPLFLGTLAVGFWAIYLIHRDAWWAAIPAGPVLTLALMAGFDGFTGFNSSLVFLVGLALTCCLVFLSTRRRWALFLAAGLATFGMFTLAGVANYAGPAALIGAGVVLTLRVLRPAR